MLNLQLLQALCAVQTQSRHEERMVHFLEGYCIGKGWAVRRDAIGNMRITKGHADVYPAVCAHIDSVQPLDRMIYLTCEPDIIFARDKNGNRIGFGADDKTGVYVCLDLLECTEGPLVAFFFVREEIGMEGASLAIPAWFKDIGYVIEFDCPARYMVSYTCGGVRLWKNRSDFAKVIVPVLRSHKYTHWQNHPFTDVKMLRMRFPISCLNLSSGYYNWHAPNEYIRLSEVKASVCVGNELISWLGARRYRCPVAFSTHTDAAPAQAIESLVIIDEHAQKIVSTCPVGLPTRSDLVVSPRRSGV